MKRSTKITSIIVIFFLVIAGVIIARTMIGNHFKKKFSKRPPPGIIVKTVEQRKFQNIIETFGTAVPIKTQSYNIEKYEILENIKYNTSVKSGDVVAKLKNRTITAPFDGVIGKRNFSDDINVSESSFVIDIDSLSVPSQRYIGISDYPASYRDMSYSLENLDILKNLEKKIEKNEKVSNFLTSIYGKEVYESSIENLSNSEFKDLCQNIQNGVPISTPVFDGAKENDVTKMLDLANMGFITATDLADYLVKNHAMSFRNAYQKTAAIVNYAEKNKKKLHDLNLEELKKIVPKLTKDVLQIFDLKYSINSKKSYGGTSFDNVKKMIRKYKKLIWSKKFI